VREAVATFASSAYGALLIILLRTTDPAQPCLHSFYHRALLLATFLCSYDFQLIDKKRIEELVAEENELLAQKKTAQNAYRVRARSARFILATLDTDNSVSSLLSIFLRFICRRLSPVSSATTSET
jgi:hypothetical protein